MGKHLTNGDVENHSERDRNPLRMNGIIRILSKTGQDSTSSVRKFYLESSSDMHYIREASGKETSWSQSVRSLKIWTCHKFMLGDSMPKSPRAENADLFTCPIADGPVKLSGREQGFPKVHLKPGSPCTWRGAQRCSSRQSRTGLIHQTRSRMTVKPKRFSGRSKGTAFIVTTLNR